MAHRARLKSAGSPDRCPSRPLEAMTRGIARVILSEGRSKVGGFVDLFEELADLRLPEAPVPAQRADRGDLAGTRPTGHGFRVDPEHLRHLGRCEQLLRLACGVLVRMLGHGDPRNRSCPSPWLGGGWGVLKPTGTSRGGIGPVWAE